MKENKLFRVTYKLKGQQLLYLGWRQATAEDTNVFLRLSLGAGLSGSHSPDTWLHYIFIIRRTDIKARLEQFLEYI